MQELKKEKKGFSVIAEFLSVLFQALLLAFFVRSFFFQPFVIPSGSMRPTLLKGDYLFVKKWSYGYSQYSFPFSLNLFEGRIWEGELKRGDVVVFRSPINTSIDFIKRVIGLPGDRVQIQNGQLILNGVFVERKKKDPIHNVDITEFKNPVDVYTEILPDGTQYDTLDIHENSSGDNTQEFYVPAGHYFMLGDNRDNSLDSRFSIGFVPFKNIIGKANIIFFSRSGDENILKIWHLPNSLRFSRFFMTIK